MLSWSTSQSNMLQKINVAKTTMRLRKSHHHLPRNWIPALTSTSTAHKPPHTKSIPNFVATPLILSLRHFTIVVMLVFVAISVFLLVSTLLMLTHQTQEPPALSALISVAQPVKFKQAQPILETRHRISKSIQTQGGHSM